MDVRRLAALALTLPVLALGACADEGSGKEPDPSPSTTSASPSPTDTGPSIPPEAQGDDEASAKAFVRYYFRVISQAMVTGEMSTLEQLSHTKCQSCNALMTRIGRVYAKGGHFKSTGWHAEALIRDPIDNPRRAAFLARIRQDRRSLFDADGKRVAVSERGNQGMHLILEQRNSGWVMVRMGLLG